MLGGRFICPIVQATQRNILQIDRFHEAEDGSLMDIKKGDIWHAPE